MFDTFPSQNGLKQRDALLPLFFNFALEYTITKIKENQEGLKSNGTHQLLSYANINTTNKNTEALTDVN
jgi:hypothetical protein